ncbi:acyl-CoA dehydrogenase family protein [Vibrio sp. J1-1]|uniref:acyl-CoA dehydrogenase family protein n=1 Tax=Vibrio sp. J1-1 TaxID=2912251 RepID=UPI001F329136|nr:acyl-CoA dehydrogenase family protein [Vibrio sp. J1-1]MCF7480887.1 acyl-CoA dehydrogenase family protein [Vibrio sp. J1-1]
MTVLDANQKALIQQTRDFVAQHLIPLESKIAEFGGLTDEESKDLTLKGIEAGLFATNIGNEYGGKGESVFNNVLIQEQLGVTKDVLVRRASGNIYECLTLGSEIQKETYLQPALRGERWCALAVSEPNAGSDVVSISTAAVKTEKGWRLNGRKMYISDSEYCDYFIVAAKTEPEKGAKGISLFLVDKSKAGFSLGKRFNMMGFVGTSHCELIFEEVELDEDALLGEINTGFKILCQTLGKARLAKVAARAIGKCVRMLNLMLEHGKTREQFGRRLLESDAMSHKLANHHIEVRAARALLWETAKRMDNGEGCRDEISMLKVLTTELVGRVADDAVQWFGASGCHDGELIESFYRDARLFRIIDGTSEVHRNIIAQSISKQGVRDILELY